MAFSDPLYRTAIGAFFISVIICQIADVLLCRTRKQSVFTKGLFSNKLVWAGIFTELLLGALIIYSPIGNLIFNTLPLPGYVFFMAVPIAFLTFFGDELRKWLRRRGNKFVEKWLTW